MPNAPVGYSITRNQIAHGEAQAQYLVLREGLQCELGPRSAFQAAHCLVDSLHAGEQRAAPSTRRNYKPRLSSQKVRFARSGEYRFSARYAFCAAVGSSEM